MTAPDTLFVIIVVTLRRMLDTSPQLASILPGEASISRWCMVISFIKRQET
ncbi:MAG: hypothetical protein NVS4B7_13640 [Ktedonobacteraceae bacterium]